MVGVDLAILNDYRNIDSDIRNIEVDGGIFVVVAGDIILVDVDIEVDRNDKKEIRVANSSIWIGTKIYQANF